MKTSKLVSYPYQSYPKIIQAQVYKHTLPVLHYFVQYKQTERGELGSRKKRFNLSYPVLKAGLYDPPCNT